jgi:hypothetical protein
MLAWLIFLYLGWLVSHGLSQSTVSIEGEPAWTQLRACDQSIFNNAWLPGDGLKCPSPYLNACFCRSDLGYTATSYISAVNYKYCSYGDVDYTMALGLYNSYCSKVSPGFGGPVSANAGPVTSTFTSDPTPSVVVYTTVISTGVGQSSASTITTSTTNSQSFGSLVVVIISALVWI